MVRTVLAALAAVTLVHHRETLASPLYSVLLATAAALALCRVRTRWLAVVAGLTAWALYSAAAAVHRQLPASLDGEVFELRGYVATLPRATSERVSFEFHTRLPMAADEGRVRLSWYGSPPPAVQAGARYRLRAKLRSPRGLVNPGSADYEAYLLRAGIRASGYVISADPPLPPLDWRQRLLAFRARLADALHAGAGGGTAGAVAAGLATGYRGYLSSSDWELLRATGITHLMAISGLHVGLVAGMGYLAGRWVLPLALGLVPVDAGALAGLLAACCYAALAGFPLPTLRAVCMLAFLSIALLLRRPAASMHALSAAVLVILALEPMAPLDPGFWLSGAAAFVILWALPGRRERRAGAARSGLERGRSLLRGLRRLSQLQLTLAIALAPLGLAFFGVQSVAGLAVNLVAIPLFSLLVVPAVLFAAGVWLAAPALLPSVLAVPAAVLHVCWPVLSWLSSRSWSLISPVGSPGWYLPWCIVASAAVLLLRSPVRWLLSGAALAASFAAPGSLPAGAARVVVLDVGQGLAVLVQTARHALVYDTGPAWQGGFDAGRSVVAPALRYYGVRAPDMIMVSHGDRDHAGGLAALRARYPEAAVVTGEPARLHLDPGAGCRAGRSWRWDGVTFSVRHPLAGGTDQGNDSSCVLQVRAAGGAALLPGDIEAPSQQELLQRRDARGESLVVVPHHGSASSSTPGWVAALHPSIAVVSAGYHNRWNFPDPEVASRWRKAGAAVISTAANGAIEVTLGEDAERPLRLRRWRRLKRRYWHTENSVAVPASR